MFFWNCAFTRLENPFNQIFHLKGHYCISFKLQMQVYASKTDHSYSKRTILFPKLVFIWILNDFPFPIYQERDQRKSFVFEWKKETRILFWSHSNNTAHSFMDLLLKWNSTKRAAPILFTILFSKRIASCPFLDPPFQQRKYAVWFHIEYARLAYFKKCVWFVV